jgi:iron(III) transport system permease protein
MAVTGETDAADDGARHSRRPARSRAAWGPSFSDWIGIAAVLVTAIALAPVAFVVYMAATAGWGTFVTLVFRARVGELLGNTAALIVLTLPACALIALGLAWLVERSDMPGRRLLAWGAGAARPQAAEVDHKEGGGGVPGRGGNWGGVDL